MRFDDRPFGGPQRCETPSFEWLAIDRYSARLLIYGSMPQQSISFPARRRTDGNLPGGGQMGHVAAVADLNAAGSPSASRDTIR